MSEQGDKWGGAAEAEQARQREELLAKLPEALREKGAKLLAACEQDLATWSYTVTMMSLSRLLELKQDEQSAQKFDLLKELLAFYRLAVIADDTKFWHKEARNAASAEELAEIPTALGWAYQNATQKIQKSLERIKLLTEVGVS